LIVKEVVARVVGVAWGRKVLMCMGQRIPSRVLKGSRWSMTGALIEGVPWDDVGVLCARMFVMLLMVGREAFSRPSGCDRIYITGE
jgi:hypothetical protein